MQETDNLMYQGVLYTSDEIGGSARCQRLKMNENICHGKGFFILNGYETEVHIHKGRVFRVVDDPEGNYAVFYCHDDSCNARHGPYSSLRDGEDSNYMYNDGDVVGLSDWATLDGVKGVFFEESSSFPLTISALSNVCAYFDPADVGGAAPEYANYCPVMP